MTDSEVTRVAAIQMNSLGEVPPNLARADDLLREAARRGARLAVLPENFALMGARETDKLGAVEDDGAGNGHTPIQDAIAEAARRYGLWVAAGTVPLKSPEPDRVFAALCVYDDSGTRVGRYNKMHLFDVGLPDSAEAYRESATFMPGAAEPVVVDTPIGRLGLSICYDLRFPELYRRLSAAGADVIVAPSAFTYTTGTAHWHLLTRARAVENLATVIAPNQAGHHASGRRTYGHSLICDAWGHVTSEARSDANEVVIADIDHARAKRLREGFPCLGHRRLA
ncbi:carbon-nitrogen hydrolase family protein [Salinisphaera sp. Q1T1-3]|uniref:carbon-nitrogen hydrolase family protein n=1 Tax=Salinisphaera sp. Q1T1-3 TaxID=2321229 RepID=UPI000E74449E|nr:carbon-nitrogen hydrolase family protein [Salinisphaera sp. Q1T1-3]RJS93528.1 carbon-nitrogen hydrolase family protein [Salinisphaera sp. Q1T1-3]